MRARKQRLVLCQELIDLIVDYAHDDFDTLISCSLASRVFLPSSRFHLFKRQCCRLSQWARFFDLIKSPLSTITRIRIVKVEFEDPLTQRQDLQPSIMTGLQNLRPHSLSLVNVLQSHSLDLPHEITGFSNLTQLSIVRSTLPNPFHIFDIISKLRALEHICLFHLSFNHHRKNLTDRRPSHCCPKFYRSVVKNARMALYLLHSRYFGFDSSTNGYISTPNRRVDWYGFGELRPCWKVSPCFRPAVDISWSYRLRVRKPPYRSLCHIFYTTQTIYHSFTQKKSKKISPLSFNNNLQHIHIILPELRRQ